jgi:hypothetical protein
MGTRYIQQRMRYLIDLAVLKFWLDTADDNTQYAPKRSRSMAHRLCRWSRISQALQDRSLGINQGVGWHQVDNIDWGLPTTSVVKNMVGIFEDCSV